MYAAGASRRRIQRFEVLEPLGAGGMGDVYRAWDPQLERDVALKLLATGAREPLVDLSSYGTLDLRNDAAPGEDDLLLEARMMARLSHPNVLSVYEVGLAEGSPFVVMEHIRGCNLREWLDQPRARDAIVAVFAQAGQGLAAAHARGIVHRDFKPENVLIGADGRARVGDFGLSRLGAAPTADGGGTPRYMAPELWAGAPATTASDVFAFATALVEALEETAALPRRLRLVLAAALAENPAQRPPLTSILAALEGATGPRWRLVGGAAGAIAIGMLAAIVTSGGAATCDGDGQLWRGRWGAPERLDMLGLAVRHPGDAAATYVARMTATLDDRRRDIDDALHGTCVARSRHEITDAQAAARASCVERRAIEVGALVRWAAGTKIELGEIENKVSAIPTVGDCEALTTAALPDDRAPVAELYDRFLAVWNVMPYPARIAPLAAVQRDAAALGESELEVRAAVALGVYQRLADDLSTSDATLVRAYQRALDIHAADLAVTALLERSSTLAMKGDATVARGLAELAVSQAEKPGISARTRARVYAAVGAALDDRGEYRASIAMQHKALDVIARDGHRMNMIELGVRFRLINSLVNVDDRVAEGVQLARDTVEFTRAAFGEHYVDYGTALSKLAYALNMSDDPVAAIRYRRQALAVESETLASDRSGIVLLRSALASDLYGVGGFEEAHRIWTEVLPQCERNEALRTNRGPLIGALGEATFQLGRYDEGLRLLAKGIDEMSAQLGRDHPFTQGYRRDTAEFLIELGRLDQAERAIATLEESYLRKAESRDLDLARLHGRLRGKLELARGRPREAEALARDALHAWSELHGGRLDHLELWLVLGDSLLAQRRWDDARRALLEARGLVRVALPGELARVDAKLARVDAAVGNRDDALAAATQSADVLARYPGFIRDRADVRALLRQLAHRKDQSPLQNRILPVSMWTKPLSR